MCDDLEKASLDLLRAKYGLGKVVGKRTVKGGKRVIWFVDSLMDVSPLMLKVEINTSGGSLELLLSNI